MFRLKSITIPDSVTSLNDGIYGIFEKCSGLTTVVLGENITKIPKRMFSSCSGLKEITFPNNLTTIDEYAFYYCSGLKVIDLRNTNITSIGYYSFYSCSKLESVLLPDSISSINSSAFYPKNFTIYGNKGSLAEEYATENSIKFDLIENYGKSSGSDVTAPIVSSIQVTSPKAGTYSAGQEVVIVVNFSESITAETMPTLKIKFGTGSERSITSGVLSGSKITYKYTIQSGDVGQLLSSSLSGGNVKDAAGNDADLTCPLISGNAIVANAGSSDNSSSSNGSSGDTSSSGSSSNSGSKSSSSSSSSSGTKSGSSSGSTDNTVSTSKLPAAGKGFVLILIITVFGIIVAKFCYYRKKFVN